VTRDLVVFIATVIAFATLVTAHVLIAIGLLGLPRRWRAPAALIVVPLAPWWAWREKMRVRGLLWTLAALAYLVSLALAQR
jgi:hypothetical protein